MTSTPSGSPDFDTGNDISTEVIADRYEVVRLLGESRLGRTCEVRDRQVKEHRVALLLLRPELCSDPGFKEEFFRRADLAQSIVGEHVNRVLGSGTETTMEDKEQIYITTNLEDGETLRDRLEREDTLGPRQAMEIARQVLMALADCHEKNLVHGDLKPANVVLARGVLKTPENPFGIHVKLLGLGISEPPSPEVETEAEDPEVSVYLAPEKVEGKPLDARSDLFSVGIVLTEALLGTRTFQSGLGEEVQQAVLTRETGKLAHLLEDLASPVRKLLLKALSRNRERRFSSAREFRAALEACPNFRQPTRTPAAAKWAMVLLLIVGLSGSLYGLLAQKQAGDARNLLETRTSEYTGKIQELQTVSGELDELRSRSKNDSEKIQELEKQLEEARSTAAAVAESTGSEPGASLEARAARAFDVFLKLIEERQLDTVALMQAVDTDSPLARGKRFLTSLEHSARAFGDAGQTSDNNVRQYLVGRARFALDDARAQKDSFVEESKGWLEYAPEGADKPDRLARLDRILAGLDESLKAAESGMESITPAGGRDEAWTRILAAGPNQDPSEVFQLAVGEDGDPDPRLLQFAESYASGLQSRVIKGNELDRDALSRERWLEAWTKFLEGSEAARNWPVSRSIRLLGCARRFFGGEDSASVPWSEVFQPTASDRADWRLDFYLRARLLENWPWLLPGTKHTVIYASKPREGSVTFRQAKLGSPPEEDQCVFTVTVYDEKGDRIASQQNVVKRTGRVYELSGASIDLLRGKARVADFEPTLLGLDVPRQAGANAEELKRFAEDLAKLRPVDRKCLVFETATGVAWLSARLGVVRLELQGAVQELIYLSAASLDE